MEKQLPKARLKRNKCTKPAENHNAYILPSLDLHTSVVHDLGLSDGSNTVTSAKGRASKHRPRSVGAEESSEDLSFPSSSGRSTVIGTAVGTNRSSTCSESSSLMITDGKVTAVSGNGTALKKRASKQQHKRRKCTDLSGNPQDSASFGLDERENARIRDKFCSERISGNIDEDDILLASMFMESRSAYVFGREDKRKESTIKAESFDEQNLEKLGEDGIPLACIFKKNRRRDGRGGILFEVILV